ncbi:MAG: hypothetical protein ACKO4R_11045, partial [Synechococcales cyanobacterium]
AKQPLDSPVKPFCLLLPLIFAPLVSTQVAKLSSPKSIAKGLSLTISTASSSPSEKCTQLEKIEHQPLDEFSFF